MQLIEDLIKQLKDGVGLSRHHLTVVVDEAVKNPELKYDQWLSLGSALKYWRHAAPNETALRDAWLSLWAPGTVNHTNGIKTWESLNGPKMDAAEILSQVGASITSQIMPQGLTDFSSQPFSINIDNFSINHTNYTYPPSQSDVGSTQLDFSEMFGTPAKEPGEQSVNDVIAEQGRKIAMLQGTIDCLKADKAELQKRCDSQCSTIESMQIKAQERSAKIDEVYRERNLLAVALARMALRSGLKAGWANDNKMGRAVVYVELLPGSQVSWHMDDSFNTSGWKNKQEPDGVAKFLPHTAMQWDGTYLAREPNWPLLIDSTHMPSVKEPTFEIALAVDATGKEYAAGIRVTGAEIARWADGTLDFIKGK